MRDARERAYRQSDIKMADGGTYNPDMWCYWCDLENKDDGGYFCPYVPETMIRKIKDE